MRRKLKNHKFVLCVKNDECDDLETRKVYRRIVDPKVEKDGYFRVIDESGDDYIYPASYLFRLNCHRKQNRPSLLQGKQSLRVKIKYSPSLFDLVLEHCSRQLVSCCGEV